MHVCPQSDRHTHICIYIFTLHIVTIITGFMKTIIMILLLILSYEFHYISI